IANRRGNVETGAAVQIWLGPFVLENVLEMVGPERPAIFPLRVASLVAFADRDPSVFANGTARLRVNLFEPRNHQRGLRLELAMGHVVVRERAVKRVLPRNERDRDVVPSRARIG